MEVSTQEDMVSEDYTLNKNVICRDAQIKTLLALFGQVSFFLHSLGILNLLEPFRSIEIK